MIGPTTAQQRVNNASTKCESGRVNSPAPRRSHGIRIRATVNDGRRPNVSQVPKLSVVVPFYNVQTYAPDALKSLELNAREDFEFLLVDDCSTDGTPDLLERAARELPGAVHLRHERNGAWPPRATPVWTPPAAST